MTHAIDVASRTLLISYDPSHGRRPDIQRLGPIVCAVGLAELLRIASVIDHGDSIEACGQRPESAPLARLWQDCSGGVSWNAALRKSARPVIHDCEQVLAHERLVTLTHKGFGPFRSRSAVPTAAGERLAELWRTQIRADLESEIPTLPALATYFALAEHGLTKVLGAGGGSAAPAEPVPAPGLSAAIRRTARSRRIMIMN